MSELIKRDAVIDALLLEFPQINIPLVQIALERVSAVDAVEVVRCSQCLHRDEDSKICKHPKAIGWDAIEPEDDDFCSYGEWRDDNGDDVV